jgi:hypothetical protein
MRAAHRYVRVLQLFTGLIEAFLVSAAIMTFAYHYNTASLLSWLLFFHVAQIATLAFSVGVIPIYYRSWIKPPKSGSNPKVHTAKGLRIIQAYIFLQFVLVGVMTCGEIAYRALIFQASCPAKPALGGSDCINKGYRTVEIATLVIDSITILNAFIGGIVGLLLFLSMNKMTASKGIVKHVDTDGLGHVTAVTMASASQGLSNRRSSPAPSPVQTSQKVTMASASMVPQHTPSSPAKTVGDASGTTSKGSTKLNWMAGVIDV